MMAQAHLVCSLFPLTARDIQIHRLFRVAPVHGNGGASRPVDAEKVVLQRNVSGTILSVRPPRRMARNLLDSFFDFAEASSHTQSEPSDPAMRLCFQGAVEEWQQVRTDESRVLMGLLTCGPMDRPCGRISCAAA